MALLAFVTLLAFGVNALTHMASATPVHDSPPDVEFLDMMTMHHQQGIEMAHGGNQRSTSALKGIRAEKHRRSRAGHSEDAGCAQPSLRRRVESRQDAYARQADDEADDGSHVEDGHAKTRSRFRRGVRPPFSNDVYQAHHMALDMSRYELKGGEQQAVKDMARETIAKQTKDIGEMRQMLKQVGGARATTRRSSRRRA